MAMTLEQFGIDRLDTSERLELIDLLWSSIPEDGSFTPPEWHLRELERRIAAADAIPTGGKPWEEVLARLTKFREQPRYHTC